MSPLYGILKTYLNTGSPSELAAVFAAPLSIKSEQHAFGSDTMRLKRRVGKNPNQRWQINAAIARGASADFFTHAVVNNCDTDIFIRMPQLVGTVLPDPETIIKTVGAASGSILYLTASPMEDMLKAGNFINFEGDAKVYFITEVDGGKITVFPKLLRPIAHDTRVITGPRVTMKATYDLDCVIGISYTDGILTDPGQYNFVESL